jgi:hypothetical protein
VPPSSLDHRDPRLQGRRGVGVASQ